LLALCIYACLVSLGDAHRGVRGTCIGSMGLWGGEKCMALLLFTHSWRLL
jgi:hypothetical protein